MSNDILLIQCQECKNLDNGCSGKTSKDVANPVGWKCSQFVFNPALLDEPEPDEGLAFEQKTIDRICENPVRVQDVKNDTVIAQQAESKQDAFCRLSEKRLAVALEKLRILGNLFDYYERRDGSRRYMYDFTDKQAADIMLMLNDAVENIKRKVKK